MKKQNNSNISLTASPLLEKLTTSMLFDVLEATSTGVVITDALAEDNPIIYANPSFVRMTGYETSEILNRNCRFLQGAETDKTQVAKIREAIKKGEDCQVLLKNHRKDGSPFWNELVVSPMRDESGKVTHFVGIQMDVTEKVEEWTGTINAVSDMIFLEGADGQILRYNKAAVDFFETSPEKLLKRTMSDLFLKSIIGQPASKLFREPSAEFIFGKSDNWYEIVNYPLATGKSGVNHWVHIVKNITARKRAASEMQRFNTAINQAADAVIITDAQGKIQQVNPAFERMTGWTQAEAQGQHFLRLQWQDSDANLYNDIIDTISTEVAVWSGSYQARRKNGDAYLEEATVSPVKDDSGRVTNYVLVRRDISEKRRLESIAQAANLMDNIGYAFSGIQHELSDPINSAKTALTVLQMNVETWSKRQIGEFVDDTLKELERVEYLLKTLKTFNSDDDFEMQSVEAVGFLTRFLSLLKSNLNQEGISLETEFDSGTGNFLVDPRALHQVLLNVFSNAVDALQNREEAAIIVGLRRVNRTIEVTVADNGIGIDKEAQSNLFKPFYTSKSGGNGLGLVIVKKMLAKMNGTIKIISEVGKGTQVIISLETAHQKP